MKEILEELKTVKERNYLVIVEGKKDKNSLEVFGINNVTILKNKPLFEIIENVNEKEVVILTDLDLEGRKLYSKLRFGLQRKGIKVNNKLRELLFRTKLRNIEGLKNFSIKI